jgi:small subunit ribosomal protein S4e
MKQHLKRIPAPKTWHLARKQHIFVTRPRPGTHALSRGLPLVQVIRDVLHAVTTVKEFKQVLNSKAIRINAKVAVESRAMVGLLDVISLHDTHYRLIFNHQGFLDCTPISAEEATLTIDKITTKTLVKGGKMQLGTLRGLSMLTDKPVAVGDTLVLELPQHIKEVIPYTQGCTVLIYKGKYAGTVTTPTALDGKVLTFEKDNEILTTRQDYALALKKGMTYVKS